MVGRAESTQGFVSCTACSGHICSRETDSTIILFATVKKIVVKIPIHAYIRTVRIPCRIDLFQSIAAAFNPNTKIAPNLNEIAVGTVLALTRIAVPIKATRVINYHFTDVWGAHAISSSGSACSGLVITWRACALAWPSC